MPSEMYSDLEKLLLDMISRKCSNEEIISAIKELYYIDSFPEGGREVMEGMISSLKEILIGKDVVSMLREMEEDED